MSAPEFRADEARTRAEARTPAVIFASGRIALGIELGSTRIKACLVDADAPATVLATGGHEWQNQLVDGVWTYDLAGVEQGIRAAYTALADDARARLGAAPTILAALGVSAMMHGYLAFDASDELLVPFRTWRNTSTGAAAAELSDLLGANIPLRWSIAHLHQAVLDGEEHVGRIAHLTTLAGYVHHRLTGERVLGVGDASGMFPLNAAGTDYDADLLARFDAHAAGSALAGPLQRMLPRVLPAGATAGTLTAAGAALLDPTGALQPGASLCPPEGDAGTGMVATNAVAPRSGNVSAGTSIFAMVVLDRPLTSAHSEIDVVATPAGAPVAMVHCNNGTSELAAWVGTYRRFAELAGATTTADEAYAFLLAEALDGAADAGGVLAYNQVAGEPVAHLTEGRPLVVRTPESRLTLANVMRAHVYGVFASLALGMRALHEEGVTIERMQAHGGLFRTAGVAQRLLAAALDAPVGVADSASEGGAWGMAVLAAFTAESAAVGADAAARQSDRALPDYLSTRVFTDTDAAAVAPDPADTAGFAAYLTQYEAGLAIERRAVDALAGGPQ